MGDKGPKVVIYPDKAGEYRWRLVAGNGEIQASGEGFETKQHAEESVESVARNFAIVSYDTSAIEVETFRLDPERIEVITTKEAAEYDESVG